MVKKCPNCGKSIQEDNKFCKYCGFKLIDKTESEKNQNKKLDNPEPLNQTPPQTYNMQTYQNIEANKHSGLGTASLILGIISICLIWLCVIPFAGFGFYLFLELPLSILATIFGGIAYFGKAKDKFGMAGFILGLIVIILGVILSILFSYLFGALA